MKIAVYALAKNEQKHCLEWADSCREADLRIVTDTGSTDGTQEHPDATGCYGLQRATSCLGDGTTPTIYR
jgi:hypothetical protein